MRITRSIVPNMFTLVNLYMGFTAIIHISHNEFLKAGIFILIAGVFDMLDGVVARLFKSTSELGVELDSLCDAVSFGVAPSFMLYQAYFYQFNEIGILFASFPAIAGVIRLARFNIQISSYEDKKYFTGLAIPSGAAVIITFVIFFFNGNDLPEEWKPALMFAITIITSLLMVSRIKFANIPRPSLKSIKEKPVFFLIFITGLVLSIVTKGKFILPFMLFYVIVSSVRHFYLWIKKRQDAVDDLDETILKDIDNDGV